MSDELFSEFEPTPALDLGASDEESELSEIEAAGSGRMRPRIRGFSRLAWLVVITLTLFMTTLAIVGNWMQKKGPVTVAELADIKGNGQMILALKTPGWFSESMEKYGGGIEKGIQRTLKGLDYGPLERRFAYAILVNEANGPIEALETLENTRQQAAAAGVAYSQQQRELESIVQQVLFDYRDGRQPGLGDTERKTLKSKLGWASQLLMCPESSRSPSVRQGRQQLVDQAIESINFNIAAVAILGGSLLTGIFVLFVFGWLLAAGRIRGRVVDDSGCGPVYIETFAIWFLLFVVTSLLVPGIGVGKYLPMILPLIALAWPMRRGVSFADFCQDVGLQPANPLTEICAGVAGYFAMLPLIAMGLVITFLLSSFMHMVSAPNEFSPVGVPHPIAHDAIGGDPFWTLVKLLLLTSVAAPLIEETMFRGVLYRHLRDASRHMTRWISVLFSAFFNGLIFAAVHPQGIAGIPALVILGAGFCLVRQWRGSLIAPITMHALHNGIVTILVTRLLL